MKNIDTKEKGQFIHTNEIQEYIANLIKTFLNKEKKWKHLFPLPVICIFLFQGGVSTRILKKVITILKSIFSHLFF